MPHQHAVTDWTTCTLCRSSQQSVETLQRARSRKVQWPRPKSYTTSPVQDPTVYTSIDDAFASVLQSLSSTSRQCKRYFKSCSPNSMQSCDQYHCDRFHSPQYTYPRPKNTNPLQSTEDVQLVVDPGTYAVTAGEWGSGSHQTTHVVSLQPGQSVNMDMVL